MTLGKVGNSGLSAIAFFQVPCLLGYRLVRMLPRAGAQTGWAQMADVNIVPCVAISSRFGVSPIGFSPAAPMQSPRNWSEKMMTTFGFAAELVCAAAVCAAMAAIAAGAVFNMSRREG